jgi:AraC-like DNA-binding protein
VKTAASVAPVEPAVTVEDFRDPATVGDGIELLDQDVVQLHSTPLRARRVVVRLDDAAVVFHSTNVRVRTRTRARDDRFAWVAFGPRARGTVNGVPVRTGLVLAAEPGVEVGFVADAGWESVAILVSAQELAAQLAARQRETEFRLPRDVETLEVDPERSRSLFGWGKRLAEVAARQPARFEVGRLERAAARADLLEALFATVGASAGREPGAEDRTRRAQSRIVKGVEDFVAVRSGEPVQVGELCRAAGVSERTLEYAFRAILGATPTAYLQRLRLHRARRALLAARPGGTTVSAVALDSGFWHFGEFSRAYRECFGELPSATLRRPPGPAEGR